MHAWRRSSRVQGNLVFVSSIAHSAHTSTERESELDSKRAKWAQQTIKVSIVYNNSSAVEKTGALTFETRTNFENNRRKAERRTDPKILWYVRCVCVRPTKKETICAKIINGERDRIVWGHCHLIYLWKKKNKHQPEIKTKDRIVATNSNVVYICDRVNCMQPMQCFDLFHFVHFGHALTNHAN